jgi:hypothetical protein
VVYLDYSHGVARRGGLMRWIKTLWSHRARLEAARSTTAMQGMVLLAVVSLAAAILSNSHLLVHLLLDHWFKGEGVTGQRLRTDLAHSGVAVGKHALRMAPIYFALLATVGAGVAGLWTATRRKLRTVTHRFGVVAVACVPLLWFFLLFQFEGLAPFVVDGDNWHGPWNPITNLVRFCVLMGFVLLSALWIVDVGRIYNAVRD